MSIAATLVLAGVLGIAGVVKLRGPLAFRVVLKQLVPDGVARPLSVGIPLVELALAVLLVGGFWPRVTAALAMVVLGLFTLALVQMWRAGLNQDCGCFGESREAESPASGVIRNAGLFGLAGLLLAEPRSVWHASGDDLAAAATIAIGLACLWLTSSTLVTRRALLFLPRSER
jgi:hypothetical protein